MRSNDGELQPHRAEQTTPRRLSHYCSTASLHRGFLENKPGTFPHWLCFPKACSLPSPLLRCIPRVITAPGIPAPFSPAAGAQDSKDTLPSHSSRGQPQPDALCHKPSATGNTACPKGAEMLPLHPAPEIHGPTARIPFHAAPPVHRPWHSPCPPAPWRSLPSSLGAMSPRSPDRAPRAGRYLRGSAAARSCRC